ncbi:CAMK/CAMK1 protein kinase, variant 1 [Aphanomyces invadans]|uniref:CAMK/CAMK1 protein kinase, variant 1 n=1 Tax=Aphanomyces invadans TaxID=157072 RepID=A0A024UI54_9STRA|nr:CAMK/CAMK1 protein kinase, variant 1 [Aphanomyces invadans]ETW05547.1 CAMK/CAMK1 protein kinase, variant 1 [Aphanomyces invadans]|eukprot:XP_008865324.1 CAMK/CAMK1 protein kinase, variant 1 [Aphanomyces invadans]
MLGSAVAGPDDFVRMPWQSFSTMKRFISEGNRLENASWRLWHMQRLNRLAARTDAVDDPYDDILRESRKCVYCNLASATLSCNGCCHDVYCVGCFKLIHMRGHLATHTAVKLVQPSSSKPTKQEPSSSASKSSTFSTAPPTASSTQPTAAIESIPLSYKVWEHKMDALFQKLMVTSMHHDGDISVHNLPTDTTASSPALPVTSPIYAVALASSSPMVEGYPDVVAIPPAPSTAVTSSASSRSSSKRTPVCNTCKGPHMTIMCPLLQPMKNLPCNHCHSQSHATAHCVANVCSNCSGGHVLTDCPLLLLPPPPPSTPAPPSSKKSKRLACGNCRGDHMTIDCPQLPQASTPKHEKAAFVRKVYTNYHNDNASNSTHAYLGDEVSVHGVHARGMTYPHDTAAPLPVYESIAEEEGGSHSFSSPSFDDNHHSILPSLEATAAERRPDVWVLSALQELPLDLSMQAMHKQGTSCAVHCWSHDLETKGFVYLRSSKSSPSTQWVRRFMVLYRNTLVEYLDESACRPIGFANVSEAEMALEDDGVLTVAVTASALRTQEWAVSSWKFDAVEDGPKWLHALSRASRLQWTDLYSDDSGVELGQGRFSVVKRARRKVPSACVSECALKIIDKAMFWRLVEDGIERNDTLFREVLTQTVLTMRSRSTHESFVVQVISLFETHDHLVIEMELMHGGDVFDRIAEKGPMAERDAAVFISHLVQAIDFCFHNGVVHRDVKLSNLALDEGTEFGAAQRSPVLKLADFGMAAFLLPNGMLRGRYVKAVTKSLRHGFALAAALQDMWRRRSFWPASMRHTPHTWICFRRASCCTRSCVDTSRSSAATTKN